MAKQNQKCMWCDNPATMLCDVAIGFEAIGYVREKEGNKVFLVTGRGGAMFTCDAPMCAAHSKTVGHICGAAAVRGTIDHCEYHKVNCEPPMSSLIMSKEEAEARRREIYAKIKRSIWEKKAKGEGP